MCSHAPRPESASQDAARSTRSRRVDGDGRGVDPAHVPRQPCHLRGRARIEVEGAMTDQDDVTAGTIGGAPASVTRGSAPSPVSTARSMSAVSPVSDVCPSR